MLSLKNISIAVIVVVSVVVVVFLLALVFPLFSFCLPRIQKQINPLHEHDIIVLLVILIHTYLITGIINLAYLCFDYVLVNDDKVVAAAALLLLLLLLLMMTIVLSSLKPGTATTTTTTSFDVGNRGIIFAATLCVISRSTIAETQPPIDGICIGIFLGIFFGIHIQLYCDLCCDSYTDFCFYSLGLGLFVYLYWDFYLIFELTITQY